MNQTLLQSFNQFVEATFSTSPDNLDTEQLQQLKMAFFGGALVAEKLISNEILEGSEASTAKVIFQIQNELIEYCDTISK